MMEEIVPNISPTPLDIHKLRLEAYLYREDEMRRQKQILAKLAVFPKSSLEIKTFIRSLFKSNEKSIVFVHSMDEDELGDNRYYILCDRDYVERLDDATSIYKKTLRYSFDTQKFTINGQNDDSETDRFDAFFSNVFDTIKKVGKGVDMLIEPNEEIG